jgi:hypothetical protein
VPHPALLNKTPYAVQLLSLTDEEGAALVVPCVQATFSIDAQGRLEPAEEQLPIEIGGRWRGDPAQSSLELEPQIAFVKPSTDVILLGHAHAQHAGQTESVVGIRVGPVQKSAKVMGDRRWLSVLGVSRISAPAPFEKIPIVHERAYGGWDRRAADTAEHGFEPRNPVGVGFLLAPPGDEGCALPNFEDPRQTIESWRDRPAPAGFGFVASDWQPRLAWAGTYDAAWVQQRRPLLPRDFDRRFFNAAAPGLVAPQALRGDEAVAVVGAAPQGRVDFKLPGLPPPVALMQLRGRRGVPLRTALDTVIVDMQTRTLRLLWRAHMATRNGLHDLLALEVHADMPGVATAPAAVI